MIQCRCSRHINLQIRWHNKISQAKSYTACMFHPRVVFSVLARCNFLFAVGTAATAWWRHQMETFSALLALCAGNSPVPGELSSQRPVTRSFDVFFDLCLNKRLSKQSWGWWFETPSCPLWRHCNGLRATNYREISAAILSKPTNQLNVFEIINSHSLTLLLMLRLLTLRAYIH